MAKVQTYILKGSMVWKLIFSVFCLLCVRVYADNTYFKPIPHYFKNTEIKDIIITQQCKDIALSPQFNNEESEIYGYKDLKNQ